NANPEVFNPYIVNIVLHTGLQQAAIEPIQYLNLETGKEEPWQIESFKYDDGFMGVTLTVRQGILWSDGMPFGPTDIAYTLNMMKANAPDLSLSADVQKWVQGVTINGNYDHIDLHNPKPQLTHKILSLLYNSFT